MFSDIGDVKLPPKLLHSKANQIGPEDRFLKDDFCWCIRANLLGGDIDDIVRAERVAIVRVFIVAAIVMVVLSVLLAGTIAGPVRRLANAAERVRHRIGIDSRAQVFLARNAANLDTGALHDESR